MGLLEERAREGDSGTALRGMREGGRGGKVGATAILSLRLGTTGLTRVSLVRAKGPPGCFDSRGGWQGRRFTTGLHCRRVVEGKGGVRRGREAL